MTPPTGEKIPVRLFPDAKDASLAAAAEIAALIRDKAPPKQPCVLGLATGSTPTGVYAELVRLHQRGRPLLQERHHLQPRRILPHAADELQSYRRFMHEHLFDHIDIDPKNIHIPDGTLPVEQVAALLRKHTKTQIDDAGGIDLQLLGIGRTGHVGFNEPGSGRDSRTRLITLDRVTRLDAASDFFGEQYVPRRAITMGVGTILAAKRVILMAFGEGKAPVVAQAVEGPITAAVAASFLAGASQRPGRARRGRRRRTHPLQEPLAARPRRSGTTTRDPQGRHLARPGIVKKPILKLTDEDYNEHGLQDLLASHGLGLRHQHRRLPRAAGNHHRLARRQARRPTNDPATSPAPPTAIFPKRVADLLPASRRRRDLAWAAR